MSMLKDFKAFAVTRIVVDLAVALIIGAAFGKIVSSMVEDVIMPVVGKVFGGFSFENLYYPLGEVPAGTEPTVAAVREAGVPVLAYGNFLTVALDFLILAFIIFMMVRAITNLQRKEAEAPAAPPPPPEDIVLLREIRDALKR